MEIKGKKCGTGHAFLFSLCKKAKVETRVEKKWRRAHQALHPKQRCVGGRVSHYIQIEDKGTRLTLYPNGR
jgi:hypothetical protein